MEPTERSMPPEMITTVAPTAMMAKKLASVTVWRRVYEFQKEFTISPARRSKCEPAREVRRTTRATITRTRPSSWVAMSRRAWRPRPPREVAARATGGGAGWGGDDDWSIGVRERVDLTGG